MCKGPEDDEDHSSDKDNDDEPHVKKGTREIVLELDNNNLPLIPEYDNQPLGVRKEIIQKYTTGHYRMSLLSMHARFLQSDHTHQVSIHIMIMQ